MTSARTDLLLLRFILVSVVLSSGVGAQTPLERVRQAAVGGDPVAARAALFEVFDSTAKTREDDVAQSLAALREAGATDVWLEAGESWSAAHPSDALVPFYCGFAWHGLGHLARAEAALARAREKAPDNPAVREYLVWNAVRRFDAKEALARSEGLTFAGVDALRAEQQARLSAQPTGTVLALGALGVLLLAATIFGLSRAARTS